MIELARDLQFFSASAADAPAPTRLAKPEPSQPVGAGMVGGSVLTLPSQPNPSNPAPVPLTSPSNPAQAKRHPSRSSATGTTPPLLRLKLELERGTQKLHSWPAMFYCWRARMDGPVTAFPIRRHSEPASRLRCIALGPLAGSSGRCGVSTFDAYWRVVPLL